MKYYAHKGLWPLDHENLDRNDGVFINTAGWVISPTPQDLLAEVKDIWGDIACRIYEYDNYDDITTFRLIMEVE